MSGWLKNVGSFLEQLDDQAERVVEERITSEEGEQFGQGRDAVESILAARGLVMSEDDEEDIEVDETEEEEVKFISEDAQEAKVETEEPESKQLDEAADEETRKESPSEKTVSGKGKEAAIQKETESFSKSGSQDIQVNSACAPETSAENKATISDKTGDESHLVVGTKPAPTPGKEAKDVFEFIGDSPVPIKGYNTPFATPAQTFVTPAQGITPTPQDAPAESGTEDLSTGTSSSKAPNQQTNESMNATVKPPSSGDSEAEEAVAAEAQEAAAEEATAAKAQETAATRAQEMVVAQAQEAAAAKAREAEKESRKLRRHVVALNKQLETTEAEIQAQRDELERAAERMEKDRARQKEQREKEKARHAEEVKSLKSQHEQAVKDIKARYEKQVEDVRKQLQAVEERRMQEGGDWNKEMADAVQREKEMAEKYAMIEDEKATLLAQIATLQAQQEALGNRVESLSQTADNAMERERDAEDRLDETLSLHARQLSQRQAREAELERTIAELGAALVVARNKQTSGLPSSERESSSDSHDGETTAEARLRSLEQEVENLHVQLSHERQRCETLQRELQDVSQERTEETLVIHRRQLQHDRQVAELEQTISRLQGELRETKNTIGRDSMPSDHGAGENEDLKQIKNLSEEVLKLREKVTNCNSENSALKSRLRVALERVEKAEAAVEKGANSSVDTHDLELASPPSGNGMRRRGGRRTKDSNGHSMRVALRLDGFQGESGEKLGRALDSMDAFLVQSGKFLRYNPVARLIFITYLLILHMWTFFVLMFHTHMFETVHGDFGAGGNLAHGPHALMQQQAPVVHQQDSQPPPQN